MTIADRAILAARRHRDRCAERMDRWGMLAAVVPDAWTREQLDAHRHTLVAAERTLMELERGAGRPIADDTEG